MDVHWLIFARAFSRDAEGAFNIEGIFQRLRFDAPPYRASFLLIATIYTTPLEAGEQKIITIRVSHETEGLIGSIDLPFQIPDLSTWAVVQPGFVQRFNDFEFPRPGEYFFELVIEGEIKSRESITVLRRPTQESSGD